MPAGVTPSWHKPSWDPTGKKLLYTGRLNGNADEALYVCDMSACNLNTLDLSAAVTSKITPDISRSLVANAVMWQAVYSRDPANPDLIFGVRYVGPRWQLFTAREDGTGFIEVNDPFNYGFLQSPTLTRDNAGILYTGGPGVVSCDFNILTGATSNPQIVSSMNSSKEIYTW